jgi:hypothetical protein
MKHALLVMVLSGIFSFAYAGVDVDDLNEIRKLTAAGKYQQALIQHIWFHQASKKVPHLGGVRNSYALSAWVELAKEYPPALVELKKIRASNKKILLAGQGGFDEFQEFAAINRALGEDSRTIKMFLVMDERYPEKSSSYYIASEDLLAESKMYEICGKYIPDPLERFEQVRESREFGLKIAEKYSFFSKWRHKRWANQRYLKSVVLIIEASKATNRHKQALEVQKQALAYFPHESIEDALP